MNDILLNKKIKTDNCIKLTPSKELKKGEIIPIVSDTMFKVMLGNESRKEYTAYFLSLILNKDKKLIEENMEFVKNELDQDKFMESKRSVDVIIKLDGKIYNIEMNNNKNVLPLERNIDYAAKLYSSSRKRSSDYKYDYIFQININNFYFEDEDKTFDEFEIKSIYDKDKSLTDKLHFMYFYLPKIVEKYYNKDELTEAEKLLLILNSKVLEDFSTIKEENHYMEEIQKSLYNSSIDDEIIGLYDKEEEDEWMRNAMKHQAFEEGKEQKKIENAINLMKNAFDLKSISKSLDISIERLEELRKENNIPKYEDIIGLYDKEEEDEWMRNAMKHQAFEEGKEQEKIKIAKNLLKENIDIETISKCSGLSIDTINDLKNK